MKKIWFALLLGISLTLMPDNAPGIVQKSVKYNFLAHDLGEREVIEIRRMVDLGIGEVEKFFSLEYVHEFTVAVYKNRASLDRAWQIEWNKPDFKSECWMVASGIADNLDLLAPSTWDKESCDHSSGDTAATQKIITHELVHVFHAQRNPSHDFAEVQNMDWFIEGLAVYASGQLDSTRMSSVKNLIEKGNTPACLADFWKGKEKYGLAGSIVMYIDQHYGRAKICSLLKMKNCDELLAKLSRNEQELIEDWHNSTTGSDRNKSFNRKEIWRKRH